MFCNISSISTCFAIIEGISPCFTIIQGISPGNSLAISYDIVASGRPFGLVFSFFITNDQDNSNFK